MDRAVIASAEELLSARHFPGVVAMCSDALVEEPDCVELLVVRARAHIALRRDLDAQADLRDLIRLDPQCSIAYRLLGELAARRDENESASIFFREALRLDPSDQAAADWLQIVDSSLRPAAVAKKLPAPAAAAGRFPVTRAPVARARTAAGHEPASARSLSSPARGERPGSQPRFARGTQSPADERPTRPFARGSERDGELWKTPAPTPREVTMDLDDALAATPTPAPLPPPPNLLPKEPAPMLRLTGRPPTQPPAHATKIPSRPIPRASIPELPGFGDYLVTSGILSRERLRAAQAYQRSMKVQLSTAIVTLGLATPQRIEWASVAHQSQLARDRQA